MADDEAMSLEEKNRELQSQLDRERKRSYAYQQEIRMLKEQSISVQSQIELEEEAITNKLMKRLSTLKHEKQAMANEVEQEEEFLTNTLQKRLQTVQREKVELEKQLEDEKEYIVNRLQKQLDELARARIKLNREKVDLENQLEAEQEYIVNRLHKQVDGLAQEKVDLIRERELMVKTVLDLKAERDRTILEKANLENQLEAEEEQIVNRLQKQIEELAWRYMLLERKHEALLSGASNPRTSESETSEDELSVRRTGPPHIGTGRRKSHLTFPYSKSLGEVFTLNRQHRKSLSKQHPLSPNPSNRPGSGVYGSELHPDLRSPRIPEVHPVQPHPSPKSSKPTTQGNVDSMEKPAASPCLDSHALIGSTASSPRDRPMSAGPAPHK
mmetsp:Transcript_30661/g.51621  ORF Transcript_30661/g.51621 Transcript_30661/m.51621 type:complete len:385 (-) Transcript_30661:65-1219(-)